MPARTYLLRLICAVLVPLLGFAGLVLVLYSANERGRFEEQAAQIARHAALVVDGEVGSLASLLRGLAVSFTLESGGLAQFHAEARRLVGSKNEIVVLRELGARQILNTEVPFGTELPDAVPLTSAERETFAQGRLLVSNVYPSPLTSEFRIAVALPIRVQGENRVLAITVPTTRIRDALIPAVPAGWVVGIGDQAGRFVTRSQGHDQHTGKPGRPQYLAKAVGRSGTFATENVEGMPILTGYYNSDVSGWLFGASIPQDVVAAPLTRSLIALILAGAAALGISILLAYAFGRPFAVASAGLAERAGALGRGVVADALTAAAQAIQERTRERGLLIEELNHRVKNTLAIVQAIVAQTLLATDLQGARNAIGSRLQALARTHDVLTRESWEGANLQDLIDGVIAPHGGLDRFTRTGPAARLAPSQAVSVALALHELATNAVKYGALSTPSGKVEISWQLDLSTHGLTLRWRERGGPPVAAPTTTGFGSRLLRSTFSGGGERAVADFASEGVTWNLELADVEPA
jgi:two-component sensor histidine kinase